MGEDVEYCQMIWRLCHFGKITSSDAHRHLGNYFGYPKCCIDNFVDMRKKGIEVLKHMNKKYGIPRNKTAHVQCLKCRREVIK